jgi:molybdopterin-containing oxidoreductase family iron-sulfur binding subunit
VRIDRRRFLGAAALSGAALAGSRLFAALSARASEPAAATGTRWGMAVDVRRCLKAAQGCVDCIRACHAVHNVPEISQAAREVKWVWREPFGHVFPGLGSAGAETLRAATVPVLCNHCDNPPCVRVCPTQATWKRADGIVMMDWHRCIGCRYCMAGCPYGSRSFNWVDPRPHVKALRADFPSRTTGVVEKCNFCEERLAKGEPPACVAACPEKALVFGNLREPASEIRRLLRDRYPVRRRPELGTEPSVYYLL